MFTSCSGVALNSFHGNNRPIAPVLARCNSRLSGVRVGDITVGKMSMVPVVLMECCPFGLIIYILVGLPFFFFSMHREGEGKKIARGNKVYHDPRQLQTQQPSL